MIGSVQTEQASITRAVTKEFAVVLKALQSTVVCAETLAEFVVIMADGTSCPAMALDTEVVVALKNECAPPCPTLQQTLRQGDAGRYTILQHPLDGHVLVLVDISLINLIPSDWTARSG